MSFGKGAGPLFVLVIALGAAALGGCGDDEPTGGEGGAPGGSGGGGDGGGGDGGGGDGGTGGSGPLCRAGECGRGQICDPNVGCTCRAGANDTCARIAFGMACNEETGQCVSTIPCVPSCDVQGESCQVTPGAGSPTCQCDPDDDTCADGNQCDVFTRRCVPESACNPGCLNGETCTGTGDAAECTCTANSCNEGFFCSYESTCEPNPEDFGDCDPNETRTFPGFECTRTPGGSRWLPTCGAGNGCASPELVCQDQNPEPTARNNVCWINSCGPDNVDGEGNPLNGEFFEPCDTEVGFIRPGAELGGTCLPFPSGNTVIGYCWKAGEVPAEFVATEELGCKRDGDANDPTENCEPGAYCLGALPIQRCSSNVECNGALCVNEECRFPCDPELTNATTGANPHCPQGETCDPEASLCAEPCNTSNDCGASFACRNSRCTPRFCTNDSQCPGDLYCGEGGVCASRGFCWELCNTGTQGFEAGTFADCADPFDSCLQNFGPDGTFEERLGICYPVCEMFGEDCAADLEGQDRFCFPETLDGLLPGVDETNLEGSCREQAAPGQQRAVGQVCPVDFREGPNPCVDNAICAPLDDTGLKCWGFCNCEAGFDTTTGLCPGGAGGCAAGTTCGNVGFNENVGLCVPPAAG